MSCYPDFIFLSTSIDYITKGSYEMKFPFVVIGVFFFATVHAYVPLATQVSYSIIPSNGEAVDIIQLAQNVAGPVSSWPDLSQESNNTLFCAGANGELIVEGLVDLTSQGKDISLIIPELFVFYDNNVHCVHEDTGISLHVTHQSVNSSDIVLNGMYLLKSLRAYERWQQSVYSTNCNEDSAQYTVSSTISVTTHNNCIYSTVGGHTAVFTLLRSHESEERMAWSVYAQTKLEDMQLQEILWFMTNGRVYTAKLASMRDLITSSLGICNSNAIRVLSGTLRNCRYPDLSSNLFENNVGVDMNCEVAGSLAYASLDGANSAYGVSARADCHCACSVSVNETVMGFAFVPNTFIDDIFPFDPIRKVVLRAPVEFNLQEETEFPETMPLYAGDGLVVNAQSVCRRPAIFVVRVSVLSPVYPPNTNNWEVIYTIGSNKHGSTMAINASLRKGVLVYCSQPPYETYSPAYVYFDLKSNRFNDIVVATSENGGNFQLMLYVDRERRFLSHNFPTDHRFCGRSEIMRYLPDTGSLPQDACIVPGHVIGNDWIGSGENVVVDMIHGFHFYTHKYINA